jgi:hypothetical protein
MLLLSFLIGFAAGRARAWLAVLALSLPYVFFAAALMPGLLEPIQGRA